MSTPAPEPPRCRFLVHKRQCRMLRADHHPDFCLFHAARQEEIFALLPEREFALAPELEALAADLTTATGVNRALGQVFRLLAQNRITRKDAVAFGYIAELLLQTVPGVRAEAISAFGHQAWTSQLQSTLTPKPEPPAAAAAPPTDPVPQATPIRCHPEVAAATEGPRSSGPIPEKPSPRDTDSTGPADCAAAKRSPPAALSPSRIMPISGTALSIFSTANSTPLQKVNAKRVAL